MKKYTSIIYFLFIVIGVPGLLFAQEEVRVSSQTSDGYKKANFDQMNIIEIGNINISTKRNFIKKSNSTEQEQEAFLLEDNINTPPTLSAFQMSKTNTQKKSVENIDVRKLKKMQENKDYLLINVHVPYAGDLPLTDISIPFDKINLFTSNLPQKKDSKIIVYCRSGRMSSIAAEEMISLGFSNVYDVTGGMIAWKNAGYELVFK